VGSSAAASLFSAMFFAGMKVGDQDVRVEYRESDKILIARCLSRNFELRVPKNGHLVTVVQGSKKTRVSCPTDVRSIVPPA
jgi:hypothetical protein